MNFFSVMSRMSRLAAASMIMMGGSMEVREPARPGPLHDEGLESDSEL
jgi:hypothetical protein